VRNLTGICSIVVTLNDDIDEYLPDSEKLDGSVMMILMRALLNLIWLLMFAP
jgi:hypothetical protein